MALPAVRLIWTRGILGTGPYKHQNYPPALNINFLYYALVAYGMSVKKRHINSCLAFYYYEQKPRFGTPISLEPEAHIGPNLTNYNSEAYVVIWNVVYSKQNNFWGYFLDIYDK